MKKTFTYAGVGVVILLLAVLVRTQRSLWTLEARLRQLQTERNQLVDERKTLTRRVSSLAEEQAADRHLLGQLWQLVHPNQPSTGTRSPGDRALAYDMPRLREMAQTSGGDLNQVVHAILTADALDALVQRHATQPALWAAAASMCADRNQALQYLQTAAERFPDSAIAQALLIEAKRDLPAADPSARAALERLRKADPTSSLADHYDALFRFKEGDAAGGVQALAAASEKDRFVDHRMELMMSRYECLRENGCSDGGALALAAFSLPFDPLPMMRETSRQALEQAEAAFAAGQLERATQTAEYVARIGRNLSASGRFLVYDRVGMELQRAALEAERRFQESAGNSFQAEEIGFQLGGIQARSAQVNALAGAFGGMLAQMTDSDIVRYIESTIMHGELTTLQRLLPAP